jgi:hypothetical protein
MYDYKRRFPFPTHEELLSHIPGIILTTEDYRFAYLYYSILVLEHHLHLSEKRFLTSAVADGIYTNSFRDFVIGEAVQRALKIRLG